AAEILDVLEPLLDSVVITQSSSPRAIPADRLADLARDVFDDEERVHEQASLPDAIQTAVDLAEEGGDQFGGVVVAGSITLTAEARDPLGVRAEACAWSWTSHLPPALTARSGCSRPRSSSSRPSWCSSLRWPPTSWSLRTGS